MIILGSTGSIGRCAVRLAKTRNIAVECLACGENIEALNAQIAALSPRFIAIKDAKNAKRVNLSPSQRLFCGESGLLEALNSCQSKVVLNAIVGFSGLLPSLESVRLNKTLALANKESLVVGGALFGESALEKIIPIDSEHFALKALLEHTRAAKRLIITASGGALRDVKIKKLHKARAKAALKHPNWAMGKKITIDSATMANKLFEILEARWLFGASEAGAQGVEPPKIDALIERSSTLHALVETRDNAIFAHFAASDMALPISYALLGDAARFAPNVAPVALENLSTLALEKINPKRYPLWDLKDELLEKPQLGVVVNAANEILVEKFLRDEIYFGEIARGIFRALERFSSANAADFAGLSEIDKAVREFVRKDSRRI